MDSTKKNHDIDLGGLVGRCFLIWGDNNKWSRQGAVRAKLDDQHYLVQFFEVVMGEPSTLAIFHISQFVAPEGRFQRSSGVFEFFEDDEHLRNWVEIHT